MKDRVAAEIPGAFAPFAAYFVCGRLPDFGITERYCFQFPNGWGASVIRGALTHDEWELAVLNSDGSLNYQHPVSENDVRSNLTDRKVVQLLTQIKGSPAGSP